MHRASRRKRTARKALLLLVSIVGGASVTALIGFGAFEAHRFLTTTPALSIDSVTVTGASRADASSIRALSELQVGDNLIAVDLSAARERILAHPWVRGVDLSRRWPHSLSIEVQEHEPVALVALGHLYYANRDAEIVKRRALSEDDILPVVTGLSRSEIEAGVPRARARLREAIAFLDFVRTSFPDLAGGIEQVHLDPVLGLSFVPARGARVHLGPHGASTWGDRLRRYLTVNASLEERGLVAARIMLSGARRPERVVVRLPRPTASRSVAQ